MKIPSAASMLLIAALVGCAHNQSSTIANHKVPTDKDVIETKPDAPLTADSHFAAGQVAESQGDMSRAILQYKMAVKLDPTATIAMLRLGMLYTNQSDFSDAIQTWKQYIKATNDSAAGYSNLGYTEEMSQNFSAAQKDYEIAIAKDPKNESARINFGLMLARQGKTNEALTQLQTVLTPAEAHYNIASVLESQGKNEPAKAEYNTALQLDPEMADAKFRLAALN